FRSRFTRIHGLNTSIATSQRGLRSPRNGDVILAEPRSDSAGARRERAFHVKRRHGKKQCRGGFARGTGGVKLGGWPHRGMTLAANVRAAMQNASLGGQQMDSICFT